MSFNCEVCESDHILVNAEGNYECASCAERELIEDLEVENKRLRGVLLDLIPFAKDALSDHRERFLGCDWGDSFELSIRRANEALKEER